MASRKRTASTLVLDFSSATADALIRERTQAGTLPVWAGWTPELREQANALAAGVCASKQHKHQPEYASCMGCRIGAKAFVRVTNGGPTSAQVRTERDAKAAAKAPVQAVAPAPVAGQAPVGVAASIGFRPRGGTRKVAQPLSQPGTVQAQGVQQLSEAELRQGIERLVQEAKRRGMA